MTAVRPIRPFFVSIAALSLGFMSPAGAQSTHTGMGAVVYSGGTSFRVWAPHASTVGVKGAFSSWSTISMVSEGNGHWSVDVPGAVHGDEYKYTITQNGLTFDRNDARATKAINSNGNSVIYDQSAFDWQGVTYSLPPKSDTVLYEMHLGTYRAQSGGWTPGHFSDAITKLNHLQELGVNVIQLMPVAEFPGAHSMGYNPAAPYAVETDYGGPDGFKYFVRECHRRGIGVTLDVVHNHYGPTDLQLWQYDGWNQSGHGGIYFYQDDKRFTPWGDTRPDYSRAEVRSYITDNTKMWMDDYRVDGFRWDSVYTMRYYNGFVEIPEAVSLIQSINSTIQNDYPGKLNVAEDNSTGLGFDGEWEAGDTDEFGARVNWILTQGSDAARDMNTLAGEIDDGQGHYRVIYTESHDKVNEENGQKRLIRQIGGDQNFTQDWARKRYLLGAVATLTSSGMPMIFQGQEMAEDYAFRPQNALRWQLLDDPKNAGIFNAYKDLIRLRRNAYGDTAGLRGTHSDVFHVDNTNKIIAYHRWDAGGSGDDVVVIMNFSSQAVSGGYTIDNFPYAATDWHLLFNSDSTRYGPDFGNSGLSGTVAVPANGQLPLSIGGYSALVLARSNLQATAPVPSEVSTTPEHPAECEQVTISYQANDGPLSAAYQVFVQVGHDGWQDATSEAMTLSGDTWTYTYTPPLATESIDFVFHDGNGVYDNNQYNDWHVVMTDCGSTLPSQVVTAPSSPQYCEPVTITYKANNGPLETAQTVHIHVGHDSWNDIQSVEMTLEGDVWTYTYNAPPGSQEIDFVFNDGANMWDNNGGNNWHLAMQDCDAPTPSSATATPSSPTGCEPVTIAYKANDGPLASAQTVHIHIGHDPWNDIQSAAMTLQGDTWTYVYQAPAGTQQINFVFNDGANIWDNNNGNDWQVAMQDCNTPLPSAVSTSPALPTACEPVTIIYQVNSGPLAGVSSVHIHIGRNQWMDVMDPQMTQLNANTWSYTYSPPSGTTEINFVFFDGANVWDNNGGNNWTVSLAPCSNSLYADWASSHGLVGASADALADPDADGMSNLLEYAFQTEPTSGQSAIYLPGSGTPVGLPKLMVSPMHLVFPRRTDPNLRYTAQFSSDLVNWIDASAANESQQAIPGNNDWAEVSASDPQASQSHARRFARVQVEWIEN